MKLLDQIKTYRDIYWRVESKEPITEDNAISFQTSNKYLPQGYGFYNFAVKFDKIAQVWIASWNCGASCD